MKEYPQREIFRHGRYVQCQVMTTWKGSEDCPKYIACNDLERGETFVAHRAMGTWCEVDIISFVSAINKLETAPDGALTPAGVGDGAGAGEAESVRSLRDEGVGK